MPRWPNHPETWKPTETEVDIPSVGVVSCVAVFDHSETEGTGRHYAARAAFSGGEWVENERTHWTVTATFEGKSITSPYSQGSAYDRPPTAENVIYSLASDASCAEEDFEGFCSSLGYDSDSRTAERVWNACRDTELQLRRLFGAKYDSLLEWSYEQYSVVGTAGARNHWHSVG